MPSVIETIRSRRTIRRFRQEPIAIDSLIQLVEAARCAPSAANRQPLEYVIASEKHLCDRIFQQLAWAAYVQPGRNPAPVHRPVAYIVVLIHRDRELPGLGPVDAAAAIQNILLAAWSKGIGSCWLGSVNREQTHRILEIPDTYEINSVVALGYPGEQPTMEDCKDDSIRYYLDDNDVLHVPKRPLRAITHINGFGRMT